MGSSSKTSVAPCVATEGADQTLPRSWYFPHRVDGDVTLTLLTQREADAFFELVVRNRQHLGRWLPFVNQYQSVSDAVAFARASLERIGEGSAMGCLVWHREYLAGWVELLNIDRAMRQGEIAFWLGAEFEHQGIARRAASALIEHAFTRMEFSTVCAKVAPDNTRSRALLDRLGFTSERQDGKLVYHMGRDAWARHTNQACADAVP